MDGLVTAFNATVEGTPYWFAAPRANNFLLLTIFFQLFSVDQVVLRMPLVMIARHLSQDLSHSLSYSTDQNT